MSVELSCFLFFLALLIFFICIRSAKKDAIRREQREKENEKKVEENNLYVKQKLKELKPGKPYKKDSIEVINTAIGYGRKGYYKDKEYLEKYYVKIASKEASINIEVKSVPSYRYFQPYGDEKLEGSAIRYVFYDTLIEIIPLEDKLYIVKWIENTWKEVSPHLFFLCFIFPFTYYQNFIKLSQIILTNTYERYF